ncbi:MAG: hypothetical protein ABR589_01855, partial [Chthoniobacterales bacterium]
TEPGKRDPAVERLLAALTPEQRRELDQLNDQQVLALLTQGEGQGDLTPPEPVAVEAPLEEPEEDHPPPPPPPPDTGGDDEGETVPGKEGFDVTDGPTYPGRGSTEDFEGEATGDLEPGTTGGAPPPGGLRGSGIDTRSIANGQQAAEAEKQRRTDGAYAAASELDAEIRAAEHEARNEAKQLRQLEAERDAAQDKADRQRQRQRQQRIDEQRRRTNEALKRYLAKKKQRDRMLAMRRAAQRQAAPRRRSTPQHPVTPPRVQRPPAKQPPAHQSGGIIDPPQ